MNSQNKKRLQIILLVLVAVLTLGIGYASITAVNLIINENGTASVNQENFKVYFTNASITDGKGTVSIDDDDSTIGYFNITGLSKVGDYAEATYTVLNNSNGVGAQITLQLTNSNSDYFKVTETIEDDKLQAGEDTTATVKVEMIKTPLTDTVSTSVSATLKASPIGDADAAGGNSTSKQIPTAFEGDSWATIKTNVQNGNTSQYNIGDTKSVTINGIDYRVRIANKSTAQNCSDTNYSETACGFVVEFAEVVERRAMNSTKTNVGGWPATELRTYLNGTFYASLSSDLQAAIKPTRVISGYGCNGDFDYTNKVCGNPDNSGNNFTSTDNLYLLSGVEVFGSDNYDIAAGTTHQLEFYQGMEVDATTSWGAQAYSRTYKGYNGSDGSKEYWWLRPANSIYNDCFQGVGYGYLASPTAASKIGLAPAFRIG